MTDAQKDATIIKLTARLEREKANRQTAEENRKTAERDRKTAEGNLKTAKKSLETTERSLQAAEGDAAALQGQTLRLASTLSGAAAKDAPAGPPGRGIRRLHETVQVAERTGKPLSDATVARVTAEFKEVHAKDNTGRQRSAPIPPAIPPAEGGDSKHLRGKGAPKVKDDKQSHPAADPRNGEQCKELLWGFCQMFLKVYHAMIVVSAAIYLAQTPQLRYCVLLGPLIVLHALRSYGKMESYTSAIRGIFMVTFVVAVILETREKSITPIPWSIFCVMLMDRNLKEIYREPGNALLNKALKPLVQAVGTPAVRMIVTTACNVIIWIHVPPVKPVTNPTDTQPDKEKIEGLLQDWENTQRAQAPAMLLQHAFQYILKDDTRCYTALLVLLMGVGVWILHQQEEEFTTQEDGEKINSQRKWALWQDFSVKTGFFAFSLLLVCFFFPVVSVSLRGLSVSCGNVGSISTFLQGSPNAQYTSLDGNPSITRSVSLGKNTNLSHEMKCHVVGVKQTTKDHPIVLWVDQTCHETNENMNAAINKLKDEAKENCKTFRNGIWTWILQEYVPSMMKQFMAMSTVLTHLYACVMTTKVETLPRQCWTWVIVECLTTMGTWYMVFGSPMRSASKTSINNRLETDVCWCWTFHVMAGMCAPVLLGLVKITEGEKRGEKGDDNHYQCGIRTYIKVALLFWVSFFIYRSVFELFSTVFAPVVPILNGMNFCFAQVTKGFGYVTAVLESVAQNGTKTGGGGTPG